MSKDKLLPASIVFLGISLIISANIISEVLEINGRFAGEGVSIGNDYLFSRKALDQWVESSTEIR